MTSFQYGIMMTDVISIIYLGYAVQLEFFLNTNFLINFCKCDVVQFVNLLFCFFPAVLFFIYSSSMIPLAFFASVFIKTIQQAVNMGMLIFIVGLMFVSIVGKECMLYVCVLY